MSYRKWTFLGCAALILCLAAGSLFAQDPATLIRDLSWRNIGPANMSGRISDIEALESEQERLVQTVELLMQKAPDSNLYTLVD